ncbi:MAG: hypothetical protein WEC33_02970 [Dehalococcoidia bacterium]
MNEHDTNDDATLAALAQANPVTGGSEGRAALFEQITRSDPVTNPAWRSAPAIVGGTAAVIAVTVVAGVLMTRGGSSTPTPADGTGDELTDPGGGFAGMCIELYSLERLPNREWAFDGVVESIEGFQATFSVNEYYKGDLGESVTLQAGPLTGVTSVGDDTVLAVGERYLISGDSDAAWGCGFSKPYSDDVAAEWQAALGG